VLSFCGKIAIAGSGDLSSESIYKVSPTFEDLRRQRAEVEKALLKPNCPPEGTELFPAADDETWKFIQSPIEDYDDYAVIIGGRYGGLVQGGISYTEKEYGTRTRRAVHQIHSWRSLQAATQENTIVEQVLSCRQS
jgi:Domain of unknown function (DUF4062)